MYQYFHKLRVRFAELEMKQGEVAKRANMAESTLTARMTGRLPWNGDEMFNRSCITRSSPETASSSSSTFVIFGVSITKTSHFT